MSEEDLRHRLLARYFSRTEPRPHGDVFLVKNLPPEVAATLNGVYSRSPNSMRVNFLERLEKGLAISGKSLSAITDRDVGDDFLTDVLADRSGQFLKTYAIDHGHNSLREGSIVHLAVENVSQLVTRFCQRERRCSFEESSTRYISFSAEGHWRDPAVTAAGGTAKDAYEQILSETFAFYRELEQPLLAHLAEKHPLQQGQNERARMRALKAEAFDASRYLLTPAIHTKWGMVCDARTLSDMVSELRSHPLEEFRIVGDRLFEEASTVLPTLLAHARSNDFLAEQYETLPALAEAVAGADSHQAVRGSATPTCRLLAHDPDLDTRLCASLVYEQSNLPFDELCTRIRSMPAQQCAAIVDRAMQSRGSRDPWPSGLEGAQPFDFELLVDFGAYRDIGRHRKGFQQQQRLTVDHGFLVPPLIDEAGYGDRYREVLERTAEAQRLVAAEHPLAAGYVTPFAFLQRVRLIFEPRQVAYFTELRTGQEGHFAYRQAALDMLAEVREVSPLFARFMRAHEAPTAIGRMHAEQTADTRRRQRMERAGDIPAS